MTLKYELFYNVLYSVTLYLCYRCCYSRMLMFIQSHQLKADVSNYRESHQILFAVVTLVV